MNEAAALYEELRSSVLDRCPRSYRAGYALLVGRGVVAWMRAWVSCQGQRRVRVPVEPRLAHSPREVACELTQVLAAMVLGQGREASL